MPHTCENKTVLAYSVSGDAWENGTVDLIRALNRECSDLGIGEFLGGSWTKAQSWWSNLGRGA